MRKINSLLAFTAITIVAAFGAIKPANASQMDIVDTAASAGGFNTLLAAAEAAGLVDALKAEGPLTVFAPTDDAFAMLPEGTVSELLQPENVSKLQAVLKYHVVSGSVMSTQAAKVDSAKTLLGQDINIKPMRNTLAINDATVLSADIKASNGVIHVIDKVLLPSDIVAVASGAGSFNTLTAAIEAAGLTDTLKSGGPFTVFAPTDDAFAKLPQGTVEDLLKPENRQKLTDILTYHVVPGIWNAEQVVASEHAPTVNGASLMISVDEGGVMVGGSKVVATDIQAFNGVIHVIDTVMIPVAATDGAHAKAKSWSGSCGH